MRVVVNLMVAVLTLLCPAIGCQKHSEQKRAVEDEKRPSTDKSTDKGDAKKEDVKVPQPAAVAAEDREKQVINELKRFTVALQDGDAAERREAAHQMELRINTVINPRMRMALMDAYATGAIGPPKEIAREVIEKLNFFLNNLAADTPLVLALGKAIGDRDEGVRQGAARVVALLGPRAKAAVSILLKYLDGGASPSVSTAAEALWWVDRNAGVAVALEKELRSGNTERCQRAVMVLQHMVKPPQLDDPEIRAWFDGFEDYLKRNPHPWVDPETQRQAILSGYAHFQVSDGQVTQLFVGNNMALLFAVAGQGKDVPGSDKLLSHLPEAVFKTLGPVLVSKAVDAQDPHRQASRRLVDRCPHSEKELESLPKLYAIITDPNNPLRDDAKLLLGRFPFSQKELNFLPQLYAIISDPKSPLRDDAKQLLGRSPYSEKELDFLTGATKKKDFRDNASTVAVPRLVAALGSADAKVRKKAAEGLHGFGDLARPAVPALVKAAVQELDVPARYAARQALKAIDLETYKKALEP